MDSDNRFVYLFAGRKFVAALVGTAVIVGMRFAGQVDDIGGLALIGSITALWVTYAAAQGLADAFGGKR